jgi:hypothetical protein
MKSKKISHSKAKPKAGPKTSSNFEKFYKNSDKKKRLVQIWKEILLKKEF